MGNVTYWMVVVENTDGSHDELVSLGGNPDQALGGAGILGRRVVSMRRIPTELAVSMIQAEPL